MMDRTFNSINRNDVNGLKRQQAWSHRSTRQANKPHRKMPGASTSHGIEIKSPTQTHNRLSVHNSGQFGVNRLSTRETKERIHRRGIRQYVQAKTINNGSPHNVLAMATNRLTTIDVQLRHIRLIASNQSACPADLSSTLLAFPGYSPPCACTREDTQT